jgi:hypothetical protein
MYQFQSEATPSPVDTVRCMDTLEPHAPTWIEPLTIHSARNPAMPWVAAAMDGNTGESELLQELAHGINVDTSMLPHEICDRTEAAKWGGAEHSLKTLFWLIRPKHHSTTPTTTSARAVQCRASTHDHHRAPYARTKGRP